MHNALEKSAEVNHLLFIFLFESWNPLMEQIIWMKISFLPIMTCHEDNNFMASIAIVTGLKIIDFHLKSNKCINSIKVSVLLKIQNPKS